MAQGILSDMAEWAVSDSGIWTVNERSISRARIYLLLQGITSRYMDARTSHNMDVRTTKYTLWIPEKDVQARPETQTSSLHHAEAVGDIVIPILHIPKSKGERERISSYLNGEFSVQDFYGTLIDTNRPIQMPELQDETAFHNKDAAVAQAESLGADVISMSETDDAELDEDYDSERLTRRRVRSVRIKSLCNLVSALISRMEANAFRIAEGLSDVAVVMQEGKLRAAALLIRPFVAGGKFQVCFIFGDNKWRRRRGMHIDLVRMTFRERQSYLSESGSLLEFTCTCYEYRKHDNCQHKDATFCNIENKLRVLTLANRDLSPVVNGDSQNGWNTLRIPQLPRDDVQLWQVYKRRCLSSEFRTSATVLLDMRKSRLGKGHRERLLCSACPGVAKNRMLCAHETAALESMDDNLHNDNHIIGGDLGNNEEPQQDYWDTIMDNEALEGHSADDETVGAPNGGAVNEISYGSSHPRFFFPCPSDESALDRILRIEHMLKENGPTGDNSIGFIGMDDMVICPRCKMDLTQLESRITIARKALLHTLHHGTIYIQVTDFSCGDCRQYIPYDGYSDALFCVDKNHILTRELLDAWLWGLCGTGGTFRDVFSSWQTQGLAPSSSFHRLGAEINLHRQKGNEAFSAFLKTLRFPHDDDLYALFSCPKCERDTESASRDLGAVVMDGTALGILGTLPKFNRETRLVSAVARVPDRQYIMRKPKSRSFVDAILTSAKGAGGMEYFNVPLKIGLWRKKEELVSRIFEYGGGINDEAFVVGKFMNACFCLCQNDEHRTDGDESDDDMDIAAKRMRFRHKFGDVDIRRTLIEFGRCFLVGSIAGGALRNTLSVSLASILSSELRRFFSCAHVNVAPEYNDSPVCETCSKNLYKAGQRTEETIASAARFACAIAEAGFYSQGNIHRYLASVTADIIDRAISTRAAYYQAFENNQGDDVRFYNATHRNGTGLCPPPEEDWLAEAQRTGEFFPGRPQVRPRMDFGASARSENARSCRKNYTKSETHSPGIFTVQCVCSHPKLIGISVMQECEGVSTALSVLLSRFQRLPRVCYYDNACNMSKSITLRCPWVNDDCIVVCDRFHYHGHTCNSIWDPASYPSCNEHATSGAEAINHVWNFSKSHLRFLRADNMMPFLAARAIFVNIRAAIRESSGKADINARQFRKFVQGKWKCTCKRCSV